MTDAGGGVWTSSNIAIATVGSSSGVVTSVAAGSATITYTLPTTGCYNTVGESVTSSPATIAGSSTQCVGLTTNLTDATAFGAWSSNNTAVATIGSGTGIMNGVAAG